MDNAVISGPDFVSLIVSLSLVVGTVIVLGWLYSRLRFTGNGAGNVIHVVASRGLGPKERLLLVEVGNQQLLLGITASSVQTLHTFERPVAAAEAISEAPGFAARLRSALRGAAK